MDIKFKTYENLKAKVKDCIFEVLEELFSLDIPIENIITSQNFFDEVKNATNNKKGEFINFLKKRNVALLSKYDKNFLFCLKTIVKDCLDKNPEYCVSRKYIVLLQETIENQLKGMS